MMLKDKIRASLARRARNQALRQASSTALLLLLTVSAVYVGRRADWIAWVRARVPAPESLAPAASSMADAPAIGSAPVGAGDGVSPVPIVLSDWAPQDESTEPVDRGGDERGATGIVAEAELTSGGADRRTTARAVEAAGRPQPAGIDFSDCEAQLTAYLTSQSEDVRGVEVKRLQILRGARPHLMRLMSRMPYEDERGILLKNGTRVKGVVAFCDDRKLTVNQGKRLRDVAWNDLPFSQIVDFFTYYIHKRLSYEGTLVWHPGLEPGRLIEAPVHRDAAREILLLAVLCDWYGQAEQAAGFAQAVRRHDPTLNVEQYVPAGSASPTL